AGDDKVEKFGVWLWRQRSREGRTVLVAQGDVCDGGTGFRTLLNDLGLERFAVGTALRGHGKSA
ncbi:hypothetical protein, partial [Escherichia coli]|uniref:hypothetical protein n=1 Tax=Escherichia coli TaxID=562 RepID=UPI00314552B9